MTQLIQPIGVSRQVLVRQAVNQYLQVARNAYSIAVPEIDTLFNLRGRCAGMYRTRRTATDCERQIRFNPWLFAKYFDDNLKNTVPHEVAHYVTDLLFGLQSIKPHGQQWKQVMALFGAEPLVRGDYDLTGIPVNSVKRFRYYCDCRTIELSHYRHKKIISGQQRYLCRECGQLLVRAISRPCS